MNILNKYFLKFSKSYNLDYAILNKIPLAKFKNIIPSKKKKILLAILIFAGFYNYKLNTNKEKLQINEINFKEEIYKQKSEKLLFKNPENNLDIELNFTNMNLSKQKLIKKLNDLTDKNQVNFLHEYNSNYIKNIKNSKNIKSKTKSIIKECKKIEYFMRNIINSLETEIYKSEKTESFSSLEKKLNTNFLKKINANQLINFIKEIENAKKNSIFSDTNNLINEKDKKTLYNFIFNEYDEIALRLISHLAIFKNFGFENFRFDKDNHNFLMDLTQKIFNDNKINKNENLIFQAKNFLINYFSEESKNKEKNFYFYSDYILEINKWRNFYIFQKENQQKIIIYKDFDYDVIFICGLNSNFTKSWRIPEKGNYCHKKEKIEFYLKGKNFEKIFPIKNYQLWISRMLEEKTFRGNNIRYIVSVGETKFFEMEHLTNNIPDLTIKEISERIYKSLKFADVGKRPFILVCHSMGGLIAKNMINLAELNEDKEFNKNNKGVVFFSTPHKGSNVIENIITSAVDQYIKYIYIFSHTIADHGFKKQEFQQKINEFSFGKACKDICFTDENEFENLHNKFRKFEIDYINFQENEKLWIDTVKDEVHIVDPKFSYLPEVENHVLLGKNHANLQKFSPDKMEEIGYVKLVDFIKGKFKI